MCMKIAMSVKIYSERILRSAGTHIPRIAGGGSAGALVGERVLAGRIERLFLAACSLLHHHQHAPSYRPYVAEDEPRARELQDANRQLRLR